MSLTVITPANFQVVDTTTMINYLRLNDNSESSLISTFINAATDQFTNDTNGHVLAQQTLMLKLDHWNYITYGYGYPANYTYEYSYAYQLQLPAQTIKIPAAPVTAISLVEYLDPTATWQTLTGWTADTASTPARVILPLTLPQLHPTQLPAVRVTFTAGYANAAAVPPLAQVGVQLLASHWFENRTAYTDTELKTLPSGWQSMCARFWVGPNGDINRHGK